MEESADQDAWEARIRAEPIPHRQLETFVMWIRTLFETGAPILRASFLAMADPDVSAMRAQGDANRLAGTRALSEFWAQSGSLRQGLDPKDAAERLWLLTSPEQFLLAIDDLGWTPDAYQGWLTTTLQRELLRPDGS